MQFVRAIAIASRSVPLISIVMASGLATCFFWCAEGFVVPGGSNMFFAWGQDLLGHMPASVAQRDVGFPLLIFLSGFPWTGSLTGIALIYAGFGFLQPALVYWALRPYSPWIAWLCGLGTVASCAPWLYARFMYPDAACIFSMVVSLGLLCRYLAHGRPACLYWFTAAALFASITRPAMNAVFPCLMLVAITFGPAADRAHRRNDGDRVGQDDHNGGAGAHWWAILGCIGAFALGFVAYHEYRARVFSVAALGYTPSYTGEQVFYDPYINSAEFGLVLGPEIGPAVAKVNQRLLDVIGPTPKESKILLELARDNSPQFAADNILVPTRDELMFRIWHLPNYEYSMLIDGAVDDATLLQAAKEIAQAYPWFVVRYVTRNVRNFLFDPGWAHTRGNTLGYVQTGLNFYPEGIDLHEIDLFPPPSVVDANAPRQYQDVMAHISRLWHRGYSPLIWVTSLLMLAGWIAIISAPFLFSRAFIGSLIAANGLLLYNALIVSAFADPDYRYEGMVLVLRVIVAGFGLIAIWPKKAGAQVQT